MGTRICFNAPGWVNSLSPARCQTATWTNADLSPLKPTKTHFNKISCGYHNFSFQEMLIKMSSSKCPASCCELQRVKLSNNWHGNGCTLVLIKAWRRTGAKPLCEPMVAAPQVEPICMELSLHCLKNHNNNNGTLILPFFKKLARI